MSGGGLGGTMLGGGGGGGKLSKSNSDEVESLDCEDSEILLIAESGLEIPVLTGFC